MSDTARELIKSSVPLIPGQVKLPPLDQIEVRFIVPTLLVFKLESSDAQDVIVQDLQDGLAKTIQEMPFIAADVVPESKERGTVQLVIGKDAGVWFHVKEMPELDFEELERRRFAPKCFPVIPLMPEPRMHDWDRSPVLTIQVTFITGGMILTFSSHHSVMDAGGMAMVINMWGKNTEAASQGFLAQDILEDEMLDRSPAFGDGGRGMPMSAFPHYRLSKEGWRSTLQREIWEAAVAGDFNHPKIKLMMELDFSYWSISRETLRGIQQEALLAAPNAPVPTESSILSALLWRYMSRARQLSSRGIKTTSVMNVVNMRRRLEPPLPANYLGNALAHAKTTASVADVESIKPLHELTRLIDTSIDWWTSDRMWGFIGAVDETPHVGKVEPWVDYFQGADLAVSNTGSFAYVLEQLWSPDMGKAAALRFPYICIYDGWVTTLPSKADGPVEFMIASEKKTLSRLLEDAEWRSIATIYD